MLGMRRPELLVGLNPAGRMALVHHRALNNPVKFRTALGATALMPERCHLFEGDICWIHDAGRWDFFFHHPKFFFDVPSARQIAALGADAFWTLEQFLEAATRPDAEHVRFVIELKTGGGDEKRAMAVLTERLQASIPGRYWLDSFSSRQLQAVKQADGSVRTSLHVKFLAGSTVVATAPEFPPLSLRHLKYMDAVDAVTISYNTSPMRVLKPLGASINTWCRWVFHAGKALVLGGLGRPGLFRAVDGSLASAGYVKFPLHQLLGDGGREPECGHG